MADVVVLVHFAFVVFAVLGGLVVLRWRRVAWLHLPAVGWAALVEICGWTCPLTPLELRLAGSEDAEGAFVDRYLLPVLYPEGLTRGRQVALGLLVLAVNAAIYAWLIRMPWTPRRGYGERQ